MYSSDLEISGRKEILAFGIIEINYACKVFWVKLQKKEKQHKKDLSSMHDSMPRNMRHLHARRHVRNRAGKEQNRKI